MPGVTTVAYEMPRVSTIYAQDPVNVDQITPSVPSSAADYESLGNREEMARAYQPLNFHANRRDNRN